MAILVGVVLLVLAFSVGCASYEGDRAAFCARLNQTPSFTQLAARVSGGTTQEAAASMRDAAQTFRSLERLAPRSIRTEVAALGDSAERIAARLDSPEPSRTRNVIVSGPNGSTTSIRVPGVTMNRYSIFYDELASHYGTASAMAKLSGYSERHCGTPRGGHYLGLRGYDGSGFGQPTISDPGLDPGANEIVPPGDQVPVTPPPGVTVSPAPHESSTTTLGNRFDLSGSD